ncbi:uncharacterized protein VTP21DRAFT_2769 [Calcarisporiella thermophila]|uniref:uncharacterized protein n=1 Tax=Calcarisporiella thermophila TaxID=911321 RepID=UPI0037431C8C
MILNWFFNTCTENNEKRKTENREKSLHIKKKIFTTKKIIKKFQQNTITCSVVLKDIQNEKRSEYHI